MAAASHSSVGGDSLGHSADGAESVLGAEQGAPATPEKDRDFEDWPDCEVCGVRPTVDDTHPNGRCNRCFHSPIPGTEPLLEFPFGAKQRGGCNLGGGLDNDIGGPQKRHHKQQTII